MIRSCLWAIALVGLVFARWPQLDLQVSGWFYDPQAKFWLARIGWLELVRQLAMQGANLTVVLALAGTVQAWALGARATVPLRLWGFALALFVLGPGLLVNVILKTYWGRARPGSVIEFGGSAQFTPPFQIADECVRNCSFVSGEAAAAAAMMIVVATFFLHLVPAARRFVAIASCILLALLPGILRIMTGRHFLSDVIFANLFILLLALVLAKLLRITPVPATVTPGALKRDLVAGIGRLVPGWSRKP